MHVIWAPYQGWLHLRLVAARWTQHECMFIGGEVYVRMTTIQASGVA